ncbi:MAG: hypothetical protein KAV40_05765 [Thermoplasmatales archaeon]|nr:hypothetical protein [Thermoplasmatales archaeon]
MDSNRALRATLISIILILGSLLPMFILVPTVYAEPSSEETILYFHDFYEYEGENNIDENLPIKENDSQWPPSILDIEKWGVWLLTAFSIFLFNDSEFDLNDPFLSFLDPFSVSGFYYYEGEDEIEINGDVVFDLYFKSPLPSKLLHKDDVKVSIGWLNFSDILSGSLFTEINKTITLKPKILGNIQKYEITIENVRHLLKTEDILMFSVRLIPGDKSIGKIIDRNIKLIPDETKKNFAQFLSDRWVNKSNNTIRKTAGDIIKLLLSVVEESNISKSDLAELANAVRSSSFIYDSVAHPSSVTLPLSLPGEDDTTYMYYLHDENKMDSEEPTKENPSEVKISKGSAKWDGPSLERNKILKKAVARLYIDHRDLLRILNLFKGKIKITVSLFDGETEINSSVEEFDRTTWLTKPGEPTIFTFDDLNREIVYDNSLRLEVSANDTKFGLLGFRRYAKLLYDSTEYPSSLTVTFDETDHIKIDAVADPSDGEIVPGGSVKYTLNITSKYDDKVSVDVLEDKEGDWDVTITEDQVDISTGGTAEVSIFVNSTDNEKKAYGDAIDMTFIVSGKIGIARQTASAEVSKDAIEYDVNIVDSTESKNIKKGRNGTFYLIIKNNNTGAVDDVDSYTITVTSENNWEIKHTDSIKDLEIGEKTNPEKIFAIVSVPKNTTFESDIITITVTSDSNSEAFAIISVTVNVLGPSILESIYEFFESTSNALGLDEMFGSYAPIALAAILMILILFIIIILALLLTRKSVNIICTERIKEIDPDDEATFEIIIENPTRKTQTYEISSNENPSSPKWEKSIETEKITIDALQSKTVFLTVKPTEFAEPNDWTETKVKVNILGKRKSEGITIMAMLKDGKTLLKITDVFTWPKEFKKGDRIITSFKLENKGNITARNVNAVLYINAKEKNKVEVTIPSGGYADIRMPWIAIKGKNKLHIKSIEH